MAEKDNINEMDIDIDSEKKEVPEVVKEEKKENEEYEKFCFYVPQTGECCRKDDRSPE